MLNQPILLADAFGTIISALFLLFWIVSQVMGARQEAKGKQKPKAQPRRQKPQPGQPRNQGDALRSEVEQFLRRAQGEPEPKKSGKQSGKQSDKQRQMPTPDRKPQRLSEQRQQAAPPVLPVVEKRPSLRNEGVAEHVSRHLSTQEIADHAQNLGDEVALADDKLESRLHSTFDHSVGRMEHRDAYSDDKSPRVDIAADVAAMLRSPQGMRQLIVANEILRRPEW